MGILVLAEHDNQHVKPATWSVLTAASELSAEITVLVAGNACQNVANTLAKVPGVSAIWLADHPAYGQGIAENIAPLMVQYAAKFTHILAPATTYGKNIMPRVAALLDISMVGDVISIIACDTFIRPIYAGNALATIQTTDTIKLLTIRATAFAKAVPATNNVPIILLADIYNSDKIVVSEEILTPAERPELTAARIVVSGGRALQTRENFQLIEQLAEKLGAAVGASRAAVDAGLVPNDYQVGQTGKVVAPELYMAIGISGAIQHIAGMKDSKVIVAINKDSEAPIFQIADYGLVGDLFTLVPALIQALET